MTTFYMTGYRRIAHCILLYQEVDQPSAAYAGNQCCCWSDNSKSKSHQREGGKNGVDAGLGCGDEK